MEVLDHKLSTFYTVKKKTSSIIYISGILWYGYPLIQNSANVICVTQAVTNAKKKPKKRLANLIFRRKPIYNGDFKLGVVLTAKICLNVSRPIVTLSTVTLGW